MSSIVNAIRQRIDARWKQILAYHYSAWLILTAGLMEGLHAALPVVSDLIPDRLYAALIGVVTLAAYVSKIIVQQGGKGDDDGE
jgi:hypothetical protein